MWRGGGERGRGETRAIERGRGGMFVQSLSLSRQLANGSWDSARLTTVQFINQAILGCCRTYWTCTWSRPRPALAFNGSILVPILMVIRTTQIRRLGSGVCRSNVVLDRVSQRLGFSTPGQGRSEGRFFFLSLKFSVRTSESTLCANSLVPVSPSCALHALSQLRSLHTLTHSLPL